MAFQAETLAAAAAAFDDGEQLEKTLTTHRTGLAQLQSGSTRWASSTCRAPEISC